MADHQESDTVKMHMADVWQMLRDKVDQHGVQFWILEKDYALSYLLKAISTADYLQDALVLKGGTALRKLYFPDYRFSEDLDFTTRQVGPISELDAKFSSAMQKAEELLQENGPFRIEHGPMTTREPHPGGQS